MSQTRVRRPSEYALRVWTLVTRHGMTPGMAARHLQISRERVQRIVCGVSRRNTALQASRPR